MADFLASILDIIFVAGILLALGRAVWKFFRGARPSAPGGPGRSRKEGAPQEVRHATARDPVCGMFVSTEVSHRLVEGKTVLHFCSDECLERYQNEKHKVTA